MGYFQITNITNDLGKRHIKVNTTQYVDMKNNFKEDRLPIAPGGEIFIESTHLPISVHKLRSEGLVSVVELDKNTYERKRLGLIRMPSEELAQVAEIKQVEDDSKSKKQQAKAVKKENS